MKINLFNKKEFDKAMRDAIVNELIAKDVNDMIVDQLAGYMNHRISQKKVMEELSLRGLLKDGMLTIEIKIG